MVIDTAGQPVDLATLVKAAGPEGTPLDTMLQLLKHNRVVGRISLSMTVEDLAVATRQGNPAIAVIRVRGTRTSEQLHAVVVDGVTTRMRQRVVAIRDPQRGEQYFETVDVFRQKFIGQGIIMDYTY
jgi:filamentous hemagglutinin